MSKTIKIYAMNLNILITFYSFLNPIRRKQWNFYELLTIFESSYFQISVNTSSKLHLVSRKIHRIFFYLKTVRKKNLENLLGL